MERPRPRAPDPPVERVRPAPVWAWLLLGWLLGEVVARRVPGPGPGPHSPSGGLRAPLECTLELDPVPPGIPALRQFRRVPGVGRTRSRLLVEHLWTGGYGDGSGLGKVRWEEIEGIGPVTAAALSAAFPPDSRAPVPPGEGGSGSRVPPEDGVHSLRCPVMTTTPPESAARDGERPTPAAEPPAGRSPRTPPGSGGEGRAGEPSVPGSSDLAPPSGPEVDRFLRRALEEDAGTGDITSRTAVPEGARARARLVAKQAGVLAGLPYFARTFELCDPAAVLRTTTRDGERVRPGAELATLEGDARALLLAERTALNLLQRLSGIATRTAQLVDLARSATDRPVRVLDTRKTTPGLRAFEKYAVRCGGGHNHRFGLFDEVLVKENHIDLAARPLGQVLADLRGAVGDGVRVTCEARDAEEARAAVLGGADVVLLDNMTPGELAALVPELRRLGEGRGRPLEIEASGGISAEGLAAVARSGVDRISVGALTHSVSALDVSLYLEPAS